MVCTGRSGKRFAASRLKVNLSSYFLKKGNRKKLNNDWYWIENEKREHSEKKDV